MGLWAGCGPQDNSDAAGQTARILNAPVHVAASLFTLSIFMAGGGKSLLAGMVALVYGSFATGERGLASPWSISDRLVSLKDRCTRGPVTGEAVAGCSAAQ